VVCAWGYFLVAAVDKDNPDGGIKALWPIFGIANQLLAATALCLATTVILKMSLGAPNSGSAQTSSSQPAGLETSVPLRSPAFALVTLVPLCWLLAVTGTAAVQKIASSDPRIGFIAAAKKEMRDFAEQIREAKTGPDSKAGEAFLWKLPALQRKSDHKVFNALLDACVTTFFLVLVAGIFLISVREWILLLARKKLAVLRETAPTWLPDYAIAEAKPLHMAAVIMLGFALLRELSGEAKIDRLQQQCACAKPDRVRLNVGLGEPAAPSCLTREEAYVRASEERFNGINRCC
jgi:carbon starvation protein